MLNKLGTDLNRFYTTPSWSGAPNRSQPTAEPFSTPDVFRPANPHVANPLTDYPVQPTWMPPVPSGPIVEVPNSFPMELPQYPGLNDWATPGKAPSEMPCPSEAPKHFPQPFTIEVPDIGKFPQKSFPDGAWLLRI